MDKRFFHDLQQIGYGVSSRSTPMPELSNGIWEYNLTRQCEDPSKLSVKPVKGGAPLFYSLISIPNSIQPLFMLGALCWWENTHQICRCGPGIMAFRNRVALKKKCLTLSLSISLSHKAVGRLHTPKQTVKAAKTLQGHTWGGCMKTVIQFGGMPKRYFCGRSTQRTMKTMTMISSTKYEKRIWCSTEWRLPLR